MPQEVTKIMYVTKDRLEFSSKEDAIKHEKSLAAHDLQSKIAAQIREMFGIVSRDELEDLDDAAYASSSLSDEAQRIACRKYKQADEKRDKFFQRLEDSELPYCDDCQEVAEMLIGLYRLFGSAQLNDLYKTIKKVL